MAPLSLPRASQTAAPEARHTEAIVGSASGQYVPRIWSDGMALQVFQEQRIHLFRYLVGGIVADARKFGEVVWSRDEFGGSFRSSPSYCVVLIAPDEQGWHSGCSDRRVTDPTRPIPCQCRFHRRWIPDDGQVRLDRGRWHTVLC